MRARHVAGYRIHARSVLAYLRIRVGQDFATLSREQRAGLLKEAGPDFQRGSTNEEARARCYFDLIQKRAR
jgi:hypothetical protein